jgi:hypothetical protein
MGTKDKLIERFCRLPKDFTYEETVKLFGHSQAASGQYHEGMDDENDLSASEK